MHPSPRFRAFLERPTLARWLVAIGVLLCLPSIATGLQVDDLFHKAILRHLAPYAPFGQGPLRLFTFLDGEPARNRAMVANGLFPWWTSDTLRLSFCRPLSALTHWLDHALWTDWPWIMHVHSYLWLALVIATATALYRRILSRSSTTWVAGLAALMFAVHDAHALPATWIANRNALIAVLFGLLTLAAHRRKSMLAPLALAAALASGESALSTVFLLIGHALFPRGRLCPTSHRAPLCLLAGPRAVGRRLSTLRLRHRGVGAVHRSLPRTPAFCGNGVRAVPAPVPRDGHRAARRPRVLHAARRPARDGRDGLARDVACCLLGSSGRPRTADRWAIRTSR